jgi:hypothetical protein
MKGVIGPLLAIASCSTVYTVLVPPTNLDKTPGCVPRGTLNIAVLYGWQSRISHFAAPSRQASLSAQDRSLHGVFRTGDDTYHPLVTSYILYPPPLILGS